MFQENEHCGIRIVTMQQIKMDQTYKLYLQLVLLLSLLQHHVCLCEFGLQQLFFQVPVLKDLLQVLEESQVNSYKLCIWAYNRQICKSYSFCSICGRIITASRWSYCEMRPLSFSARALFSWQSLVFRLLCSSIWAWISLRVPWKWVVISFLFRSSSLHLCSVSSCSLGIGVNPKITFR